MTELETALEARADREEAPTVVDLIERMKPQLERMSVDGERLTRIVLTELRRTPKLYECSPQSLIGAMMLAGQLGLEPGPLGHVYLIPYGKEVTFVLGYTGIIELARRGGIEGLSADVVWDCDEYETPWRNERGIHYRYAPGNEDDRTERLGVLVTWKDGKTAQAIHVPKSRVERAMKASEGSSAPTSPWQTDPDPMWRKTGVRTARPFLPQSPVFAQALASDGQTVTLDEDTLAIETGGTDDE